VNRLHPCLAFMKRHERSFLISGFLVLFVTFVVRDILLDRSRAMADKLTAIESTYLLRDAAVQLHHEIDEVDGHVMSGQSDILAILQPHGGQIHFSPDPESILDRGSVQYLRMRSETNSEFADLYRLLDVLPDNDKHRSDFVMLYGRWDKDQVEELRPVRPIGEKVDPAVAKAEADEDRKHRQDMWAINEQLQLVSASILDDAQRRLEEKEHEESVFAWWSYALYFFGGILALGGKMAGIETFET
jgi:hypothetical protein